MRTEILKPTTSKILVSWITMSLIVGVMAALWMGKELTSLLAAGIGLAYLLIASFIFFYTFYHLPYFHIEVTPTHLIGPTEWGLAWLRTEMPIEEVDLQNVNTSMRWLGFYRIQSKTGVKISVWGFDDSQFQKLMALLSARARAIMDDPKRPDGLL